MDSLVWQAREAHRKSLHHSGHAAQYRAERDRIIRELHTNGLSYRQIASQVGLSYELVAKIVQGRR